MQNAIKAVQPQALVIEDDIHLANAYGRVLTEMRYEVTLAHNIAEARFLIRDLTPDLIILDVGLPDGNGLDLMRELGPSTRGRFIVISGDDSQRAAIKSIRLRAVEILIKPISLAQLRSCLVSLISDDGRARDDQDLEVLAYEPGSTLPADQARFWFDQGSSSALRELRVAVSICAERRRGHALIVGEQGTHKNSVAQALHSRSLRAGDYIHVDCRPGQTGTSIADFFGMVDPDSGVKLRRGYIEKARGGTLVLEHVHHLAWQVQSALMSFLDSGHFRPLNGSSSINVVVAVVGITDRTRAESTGQADLLRRDLRCRLAQVTLNVPSLSRCVGDIEQIATFILSDLLDTGSNPIRFSANAVYLLSNSRWAGNIDQLTTTIQDSLRLHNGSEALDLVEERQIPSKGIGDAIKPFVGRSIVELERQLVLGTLDFHKGDRKQAAKTLGVSLKTLYNRLNAYEE